MPPSPQQKPLRTGEQSKTKRLTRKRTSATTDQQKKGFHLCFKASESKAMGKLFNRETK